MKINVYDNYDANRSTTVIAHERTNARPWITRRALRNAERRAGMMDGSYLRATGALIDAGHDGIDVYDENNRLCGEIRS